MDAIIGVELSHRFTPIAIREQLAFNKSQTIQALQSLRMHYEEVFIVATCNRLSIYAYGESPQKIIEFLQTFGDYQSYLSVFTSTVTAANNLFSTAAGLESQAIGEHQILGQIKEGLILARQNKTIGPILDELIRTAIFVGKKVRNKTHIGQYSTSLATVAFDLINQHNYLLSDSVILVIGTGNMANLVATILDRTAVKKLYVASHDQNRAEDMAKNWQATAIKMDQLTEILPEVNIIIGGTQGEINLLSENDLGRKSTCKRNIFGENINHPKLLIDFGMPRNFNPILKQNSFIHLYDLDDIKKITYEGLLKRYNEIPLAKEIIYEETELFLKNFQYRKIAPKIAAHQNEVIAIKTEEISWLFPKMGKLSDKQKSLIEKFAYRLTQKLTKSTLLQIKENALERRQNSLKKTIIVGTRGSKLALTQTNFLVDQLRKNAPDYNFEIKIIKTSGDAGQISVLGAFTSALQQALLAGEIDMAVHSFKDLPTEEVTGLSLYPVGEREDSRDVLISRDGKLLDNLRFGAKIGTGSLRRKIQLQHIRPDLNVCFIQGNIDNRLQKLYSGEFDGILLALAGLNRLQKMNEVTQILSHEEMLPAVGQGVLAIEMRQGQQDFLPMIQQLSHLPTVYAAETERLLLKALGGGCNKPIAAFASVQGNEIILSGLFAHEDGSNLTKIQLKGLIKDRIQLAEKMAEQLKQQVEKT